MRSSNRSPSLVVSCPHWYALARSPAYHLPQGNMHLLLPNRGNRKALSMLMLAILQTDFMLLLLSASPDPLHQHHHTPPAEIL